MRPVREKSVGIKDIAHELGIAISTVDRALYGRPGINPATRAKVLKMAATLGYRPNLAARSLKLNRHIVIAAHLPREIDSFFAPLRLAIEDAAQRFGSTLQLEVATYERLGHGDEELLEKAILHSYNGLILVPGFPGVLQPLIQKATQQGTSVVCVASDAPRSDRIGAVAEDAFVSGALAAELLAQTLPQGGHVAVLTGQLSTFNHAEKLRGFAATLATQAPHLHLLPVLEAHEDPHEALRQTRKLLKSSQAPAGIYVNTANSLPVMQALKEADRIGKTRVVATDLFPELVPYIESGAILATIYQRPYTQGRMAVDMMMRFLLEGVKPAKAVRLAPHIIMRSNLNMFLDSISLADSKEREEI